MGVPLYNLRPQHSHLVDEILERTRQLFRDGDFMSGQPVRDFEKHFAQFIGARNAIAVKNVTDALLLSLRALDIMPSDDVLVPAYGEISTVDVVARIFANPVFVDIEPHTFGLDPMKLQEAITERTRAIVAGHLYGNACAIDQIRQFAEANSLLVVEDASQALGAVYMNRKVGTFGILGCFSFEPHTNLGGAGEGGMVVTDNDEMAERVRRLRDQGQSSEMVYEEVGIDSRMDSFQAIVLKLKLEELDESNSDRVENARLYDRLLEGAPIKHPKVFDDGSHVYCQYVIEHENRDQLRDFLTERGIGAKVYYPTPHPLQPCFEYLEYGAGAFPVAEAVSRRVLSLPIYPGLKKREIEEVSSAVHEFFGRSA